MARRLKPYRIPLAERLPYLAAEGPLPDDRPDLGPCLLWLKVRKTDGYGRASVDGKDVSAHRAVYELQVGPIPEGLHLDHLCRRPACVRSSHLEPVTQAENNRRQALARVAPDACRKGHPLSGGRCLTCRRASGLAYYHRTKSPDLGLPVAERTHCPKGHPFDEVNTYLARRADGGVRRACRECGRIRWRAAYYARKAVVA